MARAKPKKPVLPPPPYGARPRARKAVERLQEEYPAVTELDLPRAALDLVVPGFGQARHVQVGLREVRNDHLVPAFATLLENIQHAGRKLKPFHVMLMSATGSGGSDISLNEDVRRAEQHKQRVVLGECMGELIGKRKHVQVSKHHRQGRSERSG